ncbi:MAG: electron transport complex subunit E [Firmicutes bacterium]|nr:electron transport complex subunit E [Bacillota bacterium]
MKLAQEFKRGIILENPVFRLLLGLCPVLAVTTSAVNGFGMGLATLSVLLGANIVVSSLKNIIPKQVRIPCFIVIIATFVTIVGMVMEAFFYPLFEALGLFIPLIVVNCLILGRAEAFASQKSIGASVVDAVVMGTGFTLSLGVLGIVREFFGTGAIFGVDIVLPIRNFVAGLFNAPAVESVDMAAVFSLAPGAFISLGLLLAIINYFSAKGATERRGN